ncbi:Gfo/Idh/MocA family protein [Paenibacillus hexagrammi]|uniref:Gfo/Idh/MocA family oxidoreductase n=1 Tax=Paenibacillus hexagrammi TaxID=2908839 RepID=A0ABY3SN19_9BACL|nr:Gfo/Idh/MocA family oxidoreductase [Paenibacillus sp. YPD9-1]UJF35438.1 Gfo/Idh/MocA family oxidoreductase [Paenibacillus sp. YPD9-1]
MTLRIGLIGFGFMGRTHLTNYLRLQEEGLPIQVKAVCDINLDKLREQEAVGNISGAAGQISLDNISGYSSVIDMLENEELDCVDITLPTYLHKEYSVMCLNRGLHVLCEKPMALDVSECLDMIAAAEMNDRQLMIGQCLRFWPAYEYLKRTVDEQTYGQVKSAFFFRGGSTPTWGAWLTQNDKSGGALMDMHIHDTDVINWLFGKPEAVSTQALNIVPGSGYDVVSTHYAYAGGKVVNAQADWTLQGDYGFEMHYRVNFERGNLVFDGSTVKVNPNENSGFQAELPADLGYYYQLKYFTERLISGEKIAEALPQSTMESVSIIRAEIESADQHGKWVSLQV